MAPLPIGRYSVRNEESTRKKENESAPKRKGEESIPKTEGEKSITKTEDVSTPKTGEEGDPTALTEEELTPRTEKEEESTPIPREKEEFPIGERKLEPETAGELTDRGDDALKRRNFTEAVNCFEKALRIRISDENKPAPGASYAMLKYAEAWFLKNREISKSAKCGEPPAKFKNMTRAISNEIVQKLPDGSAEDVRSLSILLAEASMKSMNEAISDGTSVADRLLLDETEGIVTAPFVPANKILQLSTMLDEEQLGTLSAKYQGDDRTEEPANATDK